MMDRYVQSFTDSETGKVDSVTFEPIEVWTESGLEIIPPGFRLDIPDIIQKLIRPDELPLYILCAWLRTCRNSPQTSAVCVLRREAIKYARRRLKANTGRFLAYVADRLRIELVSIAYMFQCRTISILANVLQKVLQRIT